MILMNRSSKFRNYWILKMSTRYTCSDVARMHQVCIWDVAKPGALHCASSIIPTV